MKHLIPTLLVLLALASLGCGAAPEERELFDFTCGDAVLEPGEQCDEGEFNRDDTLDGCRSDCTRLWCDQDSFAAFNGSGSASCFPHVVYEGDVRIERGGEVTSYRGYTKISGKLVIIGSLSGEVSLPELREIEGDFWVWDTTSLVGLDMENLASVRGDILFRNNSDLRDLDFGSLRAVGGNLAIAFNARLSTCVAEDVSEQVGEANVAGVIKIESNKPDSCD